MRTELVTTLKRKATELLAQLDRHREPILITQHGRPAAYLVDVEAYEALGRRIALKILAHEHASSPAALERFRREARLVGKLSHPNLVPILDFGKSLDGRVYLAMDLLLGDTLDAIARSYIDLHILDTAPDMSKLYTEAYLPK